MYFLGIDFGGGSSKATLVDEKGKVVATATAEYPTHYLEGGKITQTPSDWYNAALINIMNILNKGINPDDIECLTFDAATHTAVLLDENDEVICDSIYWTDTRSIEEKEYLLKNYKDYIFEKCKHLPDTIWTLPQLMNLKKESPELFSKIKHILFSKDYVRSKFCKGFVTDYIEAQGSMLFDFDKRVWDEKLLSISSLTIDMMPTIAAPLDIIGTVSLEAAKASGLSTKTKVLVGSTDTAMEVFSTGGTKDHDLSIKLATAGRIYMVSSKHHAGPNVITYSHLDGHHYYPGSATKSCASSFRWFRDVFGGDYDSLNKEASQIPLGSDGLIFHPYLNGELTPYADPKLRGNFFGVKGQHTKGHFVRAIYEGCSLSLLDCLLYIQNQGMPLPSKASVLGGGAKSEIWLSILADVLNMKLIVTKTNDSSFGSALCGAIAVGVFKDFEEAIRVSREVLNIVVPNEENHKKYLEIYKKYKKISQFLVEMSHE